ncbi:MAG: N-acetylmuramoyl-L-alanine amidase family protein, partial [Elusimicrobiota bacterium]
NSRFVIEFTEDLEYKADKTDNKLSIKIKNGRPARPLKTYNIDDGVIEKVTGKKDDRYTEFILFLGENAGEYELQKFPSPLRLVIDVKNNAPADSPVSNENLPPEPAGPANRDKSNLKDVELIVIDPGHGGKDPGAIGPLGTKEKDIVLNIAKKAAQKIRDELNLRVILTRNRDTFIPLAKRVNIANKKEADIFVSIHCNASFNPDSEGFETYFLSTDASDEEAEAVASRENAVMAMERNISDNSKVENILWSLTMNQFMNESSELCSFINQKTINNINLRDRGVKQAGFYVLKGARMPGVLLETAFISNKNEEKKLRQESFQEKIADGLKNSIKEYSKWLEKR